MKIKNRANTLYAANKKIEKSKKCANKILLLFC